MHHDDETSLHIYEILCKGTETTFSVPLRYRHLTTTTFIVQNNATTTTYLVS